MIGATPILWATGATHARGVRKLVVPYPAGGFTDVVARMVADRMQSLTGAPLVVDNRPGAGTNVAAKFVAGAQADGQILVMGTSSLAINASLYPKLRYDAQKDFRPLGLFGSTGYVLLAGNAVPAQNIPELIALTKSQPGVLNFGSSGNGSVNHLAGELFKSMAGMFITHIPYRGSQPTITDLIGGQIQLYWSSVLEALPLIQAGRVKALGVTTASAEPSMPGVAPISATLKGYTAEFWMDLFMPAATADATVAGLEQALRQTVTDTAFQNELLKRGVLARYTSAADTQLLLAADTKRWAQVIKASGASVD